MPDEAEEGAGPVGHAAVLGDQDRHHLGGGERCAADVEHRKQLWTSERRSDVTGYSQRLDVTIRFRSGLQRLQRSEVTNVCRE